MFDFKKKIKLLGYYSFSWEMPEERIHIGDARKLATLLECSLRCFYENNDVDDKFSDFANVLQQKYTYLIFKDEEKNLISYWPYKKLVRISDVEFYREALMQVDHSLHKWFVPGNAIVPAKSTYEINRRGKDIFVRFPEVGWVAYHKMESHEDRSENFIKRALESPYTRYVIYDTSVVCDDCDGWDYSYCDEDRCNDICEGCGGRRWKCNKGCFFYRNKKAFDIENNSKWDNLVKKYTDNFAYYLTHSEHNSKEYEVEHNINIDKFVKVVKKEPIAYLGDEFWDKYTEYIILKQKREYNNSLYKLTLHFNGRIYEFCRNDVKFRESGLIFVDYYISVEDTNDYNEYLQQLNTDFPNKSNTKVYDIKSDQLIQKFSIEVHFASKSDRKNFENALNNMEVSEIFIKEDNKKNKVIYQVGGKR